MTEATSTTFAPKRAPWFKGVFALFILTLLAYAVMLFMPATVATGQGAAAASVPQAQDPGPLVDGMQGLVRIFHVPSDYQSQ